MQALQVLTRWLKLRPTITDSDLNKIWKGLFYTFWHSDKQPVQVRWWVCAAHCRSRACLAVPLRDMSAPCLSATLVVL